MADRFCCGPEQNPNGDCGADGDRKPIPDAHQRFGLRATNTDVAKSRPPETGNANQNAQHHRQKCAAGKQPTKIIKDPGIGSENCLGEFPLNYRGLVRSIAIRTLDSCAKGLVRRGEVKNDRPNKQ